MLFRYRFLLNRQDIVRAHLPKVTTRWNEKIRVLAMFSDTTNSDFVLLAPGYRLADTVGEIYLNTQKPNYFVVWAERSESQSF